ncbi:NAD(P)H-hydrate dehydratase [Massilia horti]|uniref:Bifunctional NAD(P)H-hydrate repair enzyme n=1 Tax=Massilia horti TaxID=2562153 RepID=A0A4Y9SUP1_9BURK|nr:NAD(P)H-hydrate dehydratase [Massilia horti]TFW28934.1 NAD(P)H-hydrate dehydratase [Massilia horti]
MDKFLYTVDEIRAIERAATAALPPGTLMERAGQAAARFALELIDGARHQPVLVMAGPGNNGGDALEVAANLREAGVDVTVLHLAAGTPSFETARALQRARDKGARFVDELPLGERFALAVDGLFGIGLTRPLEGGCRTLAHDLDRSSCPVLALDVPSGLDADTGNVVGGATAHRAVVATHTITFIGNKPGLYTCDGRDHSGEVRVDTLGIERQHFVPAHAQLNAPELFANDLLGSRRPQNSHKGSFGDLVVLGGAQGMAGAAILAGRSALFLGAGRVFVAALAALPPYDSINPELMFRDAAGCELRARTLVAGPGLGDQPDAARLLTKALDQGNAMVIDADALNLIAGTPDLQQRLTQRVAPTVLTPHPLEAARLLGVTSAIVQADRLEAARELAARFDATIVLKGSGTVIATPGGDVVVNVTGNPGLATAGTGDVLAGICGALLAQGWGEQQAAWCAAWLHGAAADALVYEGVGPIGLSAGELPAAARTLFNAMVSEAKPLPL